MNAVLLTGDQSLLDPWRKQMDIVNSNKRVVNGRTLYPHKYGDDGWYSYTPKPYGAGSEGIYYVTMRDDDYRRLGEKPWYDYLKGGNSQYPEEVLRSDLSRIRMRVAGMRADTTTPDTRLSDDPLKYNPVAVKSLSELMLGGPQLSRTGLVIHCRLRYFDPIRRRAGVPEDVAALVEKMTDDEVVVTLVNTSQLDAHKVVVQAGGYAEHQFVSVENGGREQDVDASHFSVEFAPRAGGRLTLKMHRYVNQPTLIFPWDRD